MAALSIPAVPDSELLRLYLQRRLSIAQIAERTGISWQDVTVRLLPGVRPARVIGWPPTCTTCDRRVNAPRKLLGAAYRSLPNPDWCLFCGRARSEVMIERAKDQARLGTTTRADERPAHRIIVRRPAP